MELGICVRDVPTRDLVDLGRFAEGSGFSEIYVPDTARGAQTDTEGKLTGRDAFIGLAAMFAATSTVRGALGVAAVPMHQPKSLAMLASTLTELSDDRFSLGIGVSHPELTKQHGIGFPTSQISFMRGWLDDLRAASRSGVSFGTGWPVLLAALGPKMMQLGATHADGLVLNWLTPEHTRLSVDQLRASQPPDSAPKTVLYLRLMTAEATRRDAANYDAFANYHRNFELQGLTSVDEIIAGTTLPLNDVAAARDRIEQYRESGLDLLCLYPHGLEPAQRTAALEALAA